MVWDKLHKEALHWDYNADRDIVRCLLCPNYCTLKENKTGACGVRKRIGRQLYTLNFNYCVSPVIETIETEAVYHFHPGERILNMGNIGCNLSCPFCQNWETSQVQHLKESIVEHIAAKETVNIAKGNGVNIISWTYNDPAVWHEYVMETSEIAKEKGMINLYKSALHLNPGPIRELVDVIDIFSISLKSLNHSIYKKIFKGKLDAVLEGIEIIHKSGKHLEISQLVVPGINDSIEECSKTINWVLEHLGTNVPLHFVNYHPAYKFTAAPRSADYIESLCLYARKKGIKYSYSGNLFGSKLSNTYCDKCGALLVQRTGAHVNTGNLDSQGCCKSCNTRSPVRVNIPGKVSQEKKRTVEPVQVITTEWNEVDAYHLVLNGESSREKYIEIHRYPEGSSEQIKISNGLHRLLIARRNKEETQITIVLDFKSKAELLPILDRAHFPIK